MRSYYKFIGIPLALLLLQSCFVAKDYEQPDVVNQDYYRTDSLAQDSLSMANIPWETLFTDPLLQKYIDKALENNVDIRIALAQIKAAEAYLKQGKAAFLPTLSAGAQYTGSFPSENGQQGAMVNATGKDYFNLYDLSVQLSWEADIWGKITSQKRAYRASYLQTVAAHRAVRTNLIAGVATTYYQLLAIDKQIAITQKTIATRKNSWETTLALKKAGSGMVTSVSVAQTKAQYLDAKAILIDLEKQARLLENTLCILMGEEPHQIERTSLAEQKISTDLKVGVPMQLLHNRPDVIAAEMNYRRAFEMTNVARANFYPSLTISASGGLEAVELEDWFSLNSLFANFIGGLAAPILNHRIIQTQFEVAQVQQEQALLNFRGTLIQASKEVSDALYAYQAATQKIEIKQEEHKLLQQAVEDAQVLLVNGYANFTYLEVLRAQESALGSNLQIVNARVNQLISIVNLYQALGGGWQ